MQDFKNKVFIATPTHICKRYCAQEFCTAAIRNAVVPYGCFVKVAGNSKASCKGYYSLTGIYYEDMGFDSSYYGQANSIHRRITDTANWLRSIFLNTKCEWYLSLESDVILNSPDLIPWMIDRNASVLHSNCYQGFNQSTTYMKTGRITMGCTLIQRHVIERFPFRYDPNLLGAHYDALFALDCNTNGVEMYYDPDICPVHREDRLPGRGWYNIPESERAGD